MPAPGRAGQRDVAEGRSVEDRRRLGLGDRQLRSGDQPRVLGHRQRRPVDGRSAPRRQPLHLVDDRHRRRDRKDQGALPVPPERIVGLGRGVAADPRRLSAQRPDGQRADRRRARRLPVVPRAHATDQIKFVDGEAVREAERLHEPRSEDRAARRRSRAASRAPDKTADFCPSHLGRQELAADRVQPEDADDLHSGEREPVRHDRPAGRSSYIAGPRYHRRDDRRCTSQPGADHIGEVQAWNVDTGKRVLDAHLRDVAELGTDARHRRRPGVQRRHERSDVPRVRRRRPARCCGSSRPTPAIIGQPSSFMVDGRQYVAVQSGWGIDCARDAGAAERIVPRKYPEVPEGGAIWVFGLK